MKRLLYYIVLLEKSLRLFIVYILLTTLFLFLADIDLTLHNITLLLTLNYEPSNIFDCLAQIMILLIELSPIMFFIDIRVLSLESRSEIKARFLNNHIIVVGCGHLGRRIIKLLDELNLDYVLIVLKKDVYTNDVVSKLMKSGKPVIVGDARVDDTLLRAGIKKARAIIITVNNDLLNPIIAEKAKELNPNIRVVARIYDDSLARLLLKHPYIDEIISSTFIAQKYFAFGAFFDIVSEESLVTIKVHEKLVGKKIKDLKNTGINVIALNRDKQWVAFSDDTVLKEGDAIVIVGTMKSLRKFIDTYATKT